jgi:hypothetical protein
VLIVEDDDAIAEPLATGAATPQTVSAEPSC